MRDLYGIHIKLIVIALALTAVGVFAQSAPRISSGPVVVEADISSDGAVIRWTTDEPSTTVVEVGLSQALGERYRKIVPIEETEVFETAHVMTLQGLQPASTYYYRVRSVMADGAEATSSMLTFVTNPLPCDTDEWSCGEWGTCEVHESGEAVRSRECALIKDCAQVETPMPVMVEACELPMTVVEDEVSVTDDASASTRPEAIREEVIAQVAEDDPGAPEPERELEVVTAPVLEDAPFSFTDRIAALTPATALGDACKESRIPEDQCASWLVVKYADDACERVGIFSYEDCEAWMTAQNGGTFPGCAGEADVDCVAAKERTLVGYMPREVKVEIDEILRTKTVGDAYAILGDAASGLLALRVEHSAGTRWWPSAQKEGASIAPGVLLHDADKDGLPDETERRMGTNPDKADSDDDGVSDKDAVRQAIADDVAEAEKAAKAAARRGDEPPAPVPSPYAQVDLAFLNDAPLEQPLVAGAVDSSFRVASASLENGGTMKGVRLAGTATPGSVVVLYIYSYVPLVLTTTTDAQGNFVYDLGESLSDGKHSAYVALADDAGKIVTKSAPLSFFVREARAATEADFLSPTEAATASAAVADATLFYLWGAFALVVLGGIFTWSVSRRMTAQQ